MTIEATRTDLPLDKVTRDDSRLLIERLTVDRALLTRMILDKDPVGLLEGEGFVVSAFMHKQIDRVVRNMRTYLHDQVLVLEAKYEGHEMTFHEESGNSPVDW